MCGSYFLLKMQRLVYLYVTTVSIGGMRVITLRSPVEIALQLRECEVKCELRECEVKLIL